MPKKGGCHESTNCCLGMRNALLALSALLLGAVASSEDAFALNILVYGATGRVGSHVVDEALRRGHHVTAVSRDPSRIKVQHPNLKAVQGDLLDSASIARLAVNQDVIIVSVRGIVGKSMTPENALQRVAVENVVKVLRTMGESAPRLIHVGGAGSLVVKPGVLYADELRKGSMPKWLKVEVEGQILALEYLRTVKDVKWSYATPAKNFTNGARTGKFRIGGDELMEDDRGKSTISRADFAVALIDEAESAKHINQRFSVAY
jgi:putative NADH-flavin reductase